jgi:hypothetical protein
MENLFVILGCTSRDVYCQCVLRVDRLDTSTSSTLPTDLSSLTSTMRTARTMSVTLISKEGCGPCTPHLNVCHHAREDLMPLDDNALASALTAIGYIGIAVSARSMTMSANDLSRYLELRESSVSARREASQGGQWPLTSTVLPLYMSARSTSKLVSSPGPLCSCCCPPPKNLENMSC